MSSSDPFDVIENHARSVLVSIKVARHDEAVLERVIADTHEEIDRLAAQIGLRKPGAGSPAGRIKLIIDAIKEMQRRR